MMSKKKIKVGIGLSGGVDSSVAAALLVEKGYDVIGITMVVYDGPMATKAVGNHACWGPGEKEDVEAAASVCRKLGIPFVVVDLINEYRNNVIEYFRNEYLAGRTPNPCVVCNQRLKFGFLLKKAKETGADFNFFATGHYAQITKSGKRFLLKKAADLSKDQTYFLYRLTPEQLSHTLFPLGKYTKHRVRKIARNLGFETADRSESQDFVAGGDYSILFNKEEAKEGNIIDKEGNVLGKHRGIIYYTIGQRRGLGVASHRPLYVAKIDAEKNKIIVDGRENLFSQGLIATDLNLIAIDRLDQPYKVKIKIRLQCREVDAIVFPHENEKAKILFAEPQMSVAPGQSAVFYSDETVVGGGIIERPI